MNPSSDGVLPDRFAGVLLGTAVGDALGLPAEGLSPQVIARRWKGPWRHRFVFGRGMLSDDTEHTVMVIQSLLEHPTAPDAFQRALAWRLRGWLLALPAGVGLATARATLKLWLGFPPHRSGVASAGNGPAMRSAVLGVYFADDGAMRRRFVEASTRLTHTDSRALTAALAVAEIAASVGTGRADESSLANLRPLGRDPEWGSVVDELERAQADGLSVADFAKRLGLEKGVTGYALHSVPVAIYAWWRHRGDYRATLTAVIDCGGDTDTVGAIAGALAGAEVGATRIPRELVDGIVEWPRSIGWLRRLADRLHQQAQVSEPSKALPVFWPAILPRNLVFLLIVIAHGFARLLPR
jgi:ADP-ribosyl-[dinitrogen reductase] hydrolase